MTLICDFCLAGTPRSAYLVAGFSVQTPLEWFVNSEGAWAACEFCARAIDGDRLGDLVDRVMRVTAPRQPDMPPELHAALKQHLRLIYAAILRHRSELFAIDDPRLAPLRHQEGEPIGVFFAPDGHGGFDAESIPAAPPHPLRP